MGPSPSPRHVYIAILAPILKLDQMLPRSTGLLLVLLLAGCAAAIPGYTPPPFKAKSKSSIPLQSGDVGVSGAYEMSDEEKSLDCRRLTGSMRVTISRLRDPYFRTAPSGMSSTAQQTIAPILGGSTVGANREAEYARERAKLDAYNRHLESKSCRTLDIEAELAKPPDPPGKKY
jgi:hypothetical protein